LLGPHWLPAAPIFQWLGVCGLHQVVTSTFGWLYMSQGRGGDFFKIGAFNAIASVASFVIGLPWGGLGVAVAFTVVNYIAMLPATWWWTGTRGPVKTGDLVSASLPHGIATVACAVVLALASRGLPTLSMATCFGLVILSYGVYGFVMLLYPDKRLILSQGLKSFAEMLPSKATR
jgi:polysaccharide transporter, PST family